MQAKFEAECRVARACLALDKEVLKIVTEILQKIKSFKEKCLLSKYRFNSVCKECYSFQIFGKN